MTVSSQINRQRTEGNGVTTSFPASIKIFSATDIDVSIINRDDDTLVNDLILNDGGALGFTVTFDEDAETLTVSVNTAPTATQDILILRSLDLTQTTDLPLATRFPSESVENALDKSIMVLQDLQERLNRSAGIGIHRRDGSAGVYTGVTEANFELRLLARL